MKQNSSIQSSGGGIGCFTVIGIVFVVLKVLSVPPVASWSWIWVLSPFWIGIVVVILFILLIILIAAVAEATK